MTTIVPISQVADVLPGYAVRGKVEHDPEGSFQVVQPRHLANDPIYRYKQADQTLMSLDHNPERYRIHQGDVLFVSRGASNRAAYLEDVPELSVATSVFYILRCKECINPRYLTWYLNQTPAQAAIAQVRTGAGTPIVQRKALMTMRLPLPDLQTQQQIAVLDDQLLTERQLRRQLLERTEHYHRLIGQKLLDTLTKDNWPL
jgi:hypothetical protein